MNNSDNLFQQALQNHQAGRLVDAMMLYRQVLSLQPKHPQCHYNLALALQYLNQTDAAIASYQRAIKINPDFAEAHNNLGNIFQTLERLDDARQSYSRALASNSRLPQAQFNLGLILKKQKRPSLAVEHFQAALEIAPEYAEAYDNLCSLLRLLDRTEEWLEAFKKYERLENKTDWFFVAGLSACRYLGDFSREEYYLQALSAHSFKDGDIGVLDNILGVAQYFDVPQAQLLRLYHAYNQAVKHEHFSEFPLVSPHRTQRTKLRIGYLSADFRVHVMGKLMYEVLARHDRSQFELYLYSLATQEDALTAQFVTISDKFVDLHMLPARQAAKMIAEDDLDILIDLCNHTSYSNALILAYKPARVLITHLGAHGAIGLDTVDYKLTDQYADVPENATYLIEKLLTMEGCIFPFHHVEPASHAHLSRAELGIEENAVVFGVFANIMKFSPRCLQAWATIMTRVEHAVLAFSPLKENEKASYLRQITAVGIDPARVKFIPVAKNEQFNRARYALLDMALDTFPYSGGDTTLAALDMGVPVVTLCGQRHGERTSFSILMNLGVPETIAHSEAEYIDLAYRIASDAEWRGIVKEKIRCGLIDSPLVDMDAYTQHLEDAYRHAIAQCPLKDPVANDDNKELFQNGVRQHQANNLIEAADHYRQVLLHEPDHAAALYLYGVLLEQTGQEDEAVVQLQRAISVSPSYLDAHLALSNLFLKQGQMEDAVAGFNKALQIKPSHFAAMNGLGRAQTGAGHLPQAVTTLQQAIQSQPQEPSAYFNLGVAYQKQGMSDAAMAAYQRALALEPSNTEALFNLGVLFQQQGKAERAAACYQQILRIQPDHASAYYHLGDVLFDAGKINLWLENFKQFRRHTPPSAMLAVYGLQACQYLGEVEQQQAYLDDLLSDRLSSFNVADALDRLEEMLFLLLSFDFPPERLFALYQRYNQLSKQTYTPQLSLPARTAGNKIRLGYLSADLRDHVMGKMIYQAISRHDTDQFEVYCYSLSSQQDAWTELFRACSFRFVSIANLDALSAANRIAEDNLDILVDLSTHTKGSLPAILAYKPARLQITHIASAGAVGLDSIDFKLTDQYADTPANQAYLLERLLPMQGCVFPYRHIAPASQHNYQRKKFGIAKHAIVLGAFVSLIKLSPRCLALWRRVLEAVPYTVLAFSPHNTEAKTSYLQRLKVAGIAATRVVFIPPGKDGAHNQARYTMVDMVLDTLPYGGVNGTLEALDMGVPVVTLCGERHGERTGFSILTNLGVTATIASNEQEFIDISKRLANDQTFYTSVTDAIRRGLADSPLVNMDDYVRHLEETFRQALLQKGIVTSR
ncbi:O-linked N-acetylglucosamine transferase, SPINDLY family protein [Candidatus Nitrotoga sp. M5]|uniref:O-linked N-acetylglucosamine transferase, SPINDLY family protein n=1 Tax=Candidatus Nitrotoga sp. M5 TaxID=2890409 RepID=UPI001EF3FFF0|nr:tetratricopeptide repeat protein [Candidatus Nitrotoga sp. M5]CAH1387462.1 Protein O-GlcNAc transferase [Candidatus Nitrotoga sp. M5]